MSLRICLGYFVALLLLLAAGKNAAAAEPSVPYPEALAAAAVRIEKPGPKASLKMSTEGIVVGNGRMNAIICAEGNDLLLRISKNDVWDGRIDTAEDPAIPVVDPAAHKLSREKPGNPPSWNKPYPVGLPAADIRLTGSAPLADLHAELDLAKGLATVSVGTDVSTVRTLSGSNVVYITSSRPVDLAGVPQKFIPAAEAGERDGIRWLRQEIPGDQDIAGMSVCLAAASEGNRRAIAVVTSNDNPQPLEEAIRLARATLQRGHEPVVREHQAAWQAFWSRSGVQLADKQMQAWWYRMVYYFGCFSSGDAVAVGLKGSQDHIAGWHNSYKFNYNIQQTFFSAGPINHPELADPLIEVLRQYWPRARWFARTAFVGCEGAFVHSDVFHPHEPDPEKCRTKNQHQFAYIPFGYSLGMQGHIAMIIWESYQYRPDRQRLAEKLYPMLRDIAFFYCSFIEKCKKDEQGRYLIGPSYIPENGYFGQDNTAYDIPFVAYGLKAARDAATVLDADPALRLRIEEILKAMPDYATAPDPKQSNQQVVTWYRGAKLANDDRHGSLAMAVFPAGQVTWFSSSQEKELFARTLDHVGRITGHANSPVTLAIGRARLSLTREAMDNIAIDFTQHHKELPNGLFSWKNHGPFISEQVGVSRMICELLLQSVENTIRVFPAWPRDKDAEFAGLGAQGGLLVSSRMHQGSIDGVQITSTAGTQVRIVNPWPGQRLVVLHQETGEKQATSEADGIVSFSTLAGHTYRLAPDSTK